MYWYIEAFKHYADFKGVAHRQAFWMFMLMSLLVSLIIATLEILTDNPGWLDALYSLITIVPFFAIVVRRIRDTGMPIWSVMVILIPIVGMLLLIYFLCLPSQPRAHLLNPRGEPI